MIEIDKLYDKVYNEVTKSFELQHENLIKKENELKDKLKNEVTKIKEYLDINLSKVNEKIRESERVIKIIKMLLEEKDMKLIKKLNYVTNIYKKQKEMIILFKEPIKNLNISYIENENNIKYEELYFSGIPRPKNVEISDIGINSFKVSWKIDNIKLKNVDEKEIKYRVEIRKENNKFKMAYEDHLNSCIIKNLDKGTNYEIRINSFYKNLTSLTETYQIETGLIESVILNQTERKKEFAYKIFEWTDCDSMELLYRGTRDGMTGRNFHNKCDNKGKTICLFLNDKNYIFGGYSSIPWESNGGSKIAEDCFLFTLSNIYNTEPTKFPYLQKASVRHVWKYGPVFGEGCDLYLGGNDGDFTLENSNAISFPYSYQDVLGKGESIFTGEYNNNYIKYFKLKEIEVFKLSK